MSRGAPASGSDGPQAEPLEAAAAAMFMKLRGDKSRKWADLDREAADHYRAAAKRAIEVFHASSAATASIENRP